MWPSLDIQETFPQNPCRNLFAGVGSIVRAATPSPGQRRAEPVQAWREPVTEGIWQVGQSTVGGAGLGGHGFPIQQRPVPAGRGVLVSA